MWKQRKIIEGVSASSIVDLKAVLYEKESDVAQNKQKQQNQGGGLLRLKGPGKLRERDTLGFNRGAAQRHERDLHEEREAVRRGELQKALANKQRIYDSRAKREGVNEEMEDERNLVDFQERAFLKHQHATRVDGHYVDEFGRRITGSRSPSPFRMRRSPTPERFSRSPTPDYDSEEARQERSDAMMRQRDAWEKEAEIRREQEMKEDIAKREKHLLMKVLDSETKTGREKMAALKKKKQDALAARRAAVKAKRKH